MVSNLENKYLKLLNDNFIKSQNFELKLEDVTNEKYKGNKSLTHKWKGMKFPQFSNKDEELITGVKEIEEIKEILKESVLLPDSFKVHPRLKQYFINYARLSLIEKKYY